MIDTKRLKIEEATLADTSFILALTNSPNWIQYIGDRGITSKQLAEDYIQNSLIGSYKSNGYGLYKMTLKKDNIPIGICGFVKRNYLDHADIGFAVLPEFEGKGLVFEAASKLMTYGTKKLNLNPILAITSPDNIRSQKLLLKIGLQQTGVITPPKSKEELLLFSN